MDSLSKKVGVGTFWSVTNSVLGKAINLLTVIVILRALSVYQYGVLGLIMSIVGVFSIFSLPGFNDMIVADMGVQKGKGKTGNMRHIIDNYLKLQIVLGVAAWLIVFFCSSIISYYYGNDQISSLLRIASFTFLISPFYTVFGTLFTVSLKYLQYSLLILFSYFFKLVLILIAVFVFDIGLPGVVFATIFCELLTVCVLLPEYIRTYRSLGTDMPDEKIPFWGLFRSHGKWSLATNYLVSLNQNARLWIIKFFLGTEAVGIFSAALGIISNTTSLLPVNQVVMPIVSQYSDDKPRFFRILEKSIKYQVVGYTMLCIVAFFVFPPLIYLLFPKYVTSIDLYKVMLLAIIPTGFNVVTAVYFTIRKQNTLSFLLIARLVVMIITLPIFINIFGLIGIAYEYVLSVLIYIWIRELQLRRIVPGYTFHLASLFKYDDYDKEVLRKITGSVKRVLKLSNS